MIDILRLVFGCPKLYSIPNILRATTGCFGPLPPCIKVHKFMTNGAKSSILRVHLDFSTLSLDFFTNGVTGVTGITDKYQVYPLEEHTQY